jgi:hypothetical protein
MDEPKVAKVMLLAATHARFLFDIVHVVIATKMKDAMRQQMREFGINRVTGGLRLAQGMANLFLRKPALFHSRPSFRRFVGSPKS